MHRFLVRYWLVVFLPNLSATFVFVFLVARILIRCCCHGRRQMLLSVVLVVMLLKLQHQLLQRL
jgi:hypothetical protein